MKYFLVACCMAALISSCSSSRNAAALNELDGNWQLTVFPAATKPFAEFFSMKMPEMQLSSSDRRVSGNTGCNRITGSFSIDGEAFKFNNLATTKMGCPGYDENIYLDALNAANRFRLNADQLSLYQDATLLMTFVKKAATNQ